jgi:hypothetical protein
METIPITGKGVDDAGLVAVLHYPLATIRQLPQAAYQAHPRLQSLWWHACEVAAGTPQDEAVRLADTTAATATQSLAPAAAATSACR